LLFSEYGWDWDYFRKLTLRQIDTAVRKINKRRHNNIGIEASFHGFKIPLIGDGLKSDEKMDPVQAEKLDNIVRARMAEKQAELRRGK